MRYANRLLPLFLAMMLLLSACNGNTPAGGSNAPLNTPAESQSTSTASAETTPPEISAEAAKTYNVRGSYTVDVPADLKVNTDNIGFEGEIIVFSPDKTWHIYAAFSTNSKGFAAQKQKKEGEDKTITPIKIGEQNGFYTYDSKHNQVSISFP